MVDATTYPMLWFNDPFSSLSHLIGAGNFLVLAFFLLRLSWGNFSRFIAFGTYAFSCIFMLTMSGVYHLLPDGSLSREVFHRLDHASIYLLIVGTMTPIHRMLFTGFFRWGWLFLVWSVAIAAILLKTIFFNDVPEWLGLMSYLGLGWMGVVTGILLCHHKGTEYAKPLLWGGLAYSIGAILEFLRQPTLIKGVIGPHELFHVAVLIGLSFHWRFVFNMAHLREDYPPA
jgi:channel protein (hemolysin III family)